MARFQMRVAGLLVIFLVSSSGTLGQETVDTPAEGLAASSSEASAPTSPPTSNEETSSLDVRPSSEVQVRNDGPRFVSAIRPNGFDPPAPHPPPSFDLAAFNEATAAVHNLTNGSGFRFETQHPAVETANAQPLNSNASSRAATEQRPAPGLARHEQFFTITNASSGPNTIPLALSPTQGRTDVAGSSSSSVGNAQNSRLSQQSKQSVPTQEPVRVTFIQFRNTPTDIRQPGGSTNNGAAAGQPKPTTIPFQSNGAIAARKPALPQSPFRAAVFEGAPFPRADGPQQRPFTSGRPVTSSPSRPSVQSGQTAQAVPFQPFPNRAGQTRQEVQSAVQAGPLQRQDFTPPFQRIQRPQQTQASRDSKSNQAPQQTFFRASPGSQRGSDQNERSGFQARGPNRQAFSSPFQRSQEPKAAQPQQNPPDRNSNPSPKTTEFRSFPNRGTQPARQPTFTFRDSIRSDFDSGDQRSQSEQKSQQPQNSNDFQSDERPRTNYFYIYPGGLPQKSKDENPKSQEPQPQDFLQQTPRSQGRQQQQPPAQQREEPSARNFQQFGRAPLRNDPQPFQNRREEPRQQQRQNSLQSRVPQQQQDFSPVSQRSDEEPGLTRPQGRRPAFQSQQARPSVPQRPTSPPPNAFPFNPQAQNSARPAFSREFGRSSANTAPAQRANSNSPNTNTQTGSLEPFRNDFQAALRQRAFSASTRAPEIFQQSATEPPSGGNTTSKRKINRVVFIPGNFGVTPTRRPDPYRSKLPGLAGSDYPTYSEVPFTNFRCKDQSATGMFADVEAGCQVFHSCQSGNRQKSFLCPNGTIFKQELFTCDWWYNVNCDDSPKYFHLNEEMFKVPKRAPKDSDTQLREESSVSSNITRTVSDVRSREE